MKVGIEMVICVSQPIATIVVDVSDGDIMDR